MLTIQYRDEVEWLAYRYANPSGGLGYIQAVRLELALKPERARAGMPEHVIPGLLQDAVNMLLHDCREAHTTDRDTDADVQSILRAFGQLFDQTVQRHSQAKVQHRRTQAGDDLP